MLILCYWTLYCVVLASHVEFWNPYFGLPNTFMGFYILAPPKKRLWEIWHFQLVINFFFFFEEELVINFRSLIGQITINACHL